MANLDKSLGKTFVRSLSSAGRFLRTQIWVWPLVAAAILIGIGLWVRGWVEQAMKREIGEQLQAVLQADVKALEIWLKAQESNAKTIAANEQIRQLASELIKLGDQQDTTDLQLLQAESQKKLRELIRPWLEAHDYYGFGVVSAGGRVVAADRNAAVKKDYPIPDGLLDPVLKGDSLVSRPRKSPLPEISSSGKPLFGAPVMFAMAPLRGPDGAAIVGIVAIRIKPEEEFSDILSVGQMGETGETYAFDEDGLLLSESRFDQELVDIGLLPEGGHSLLTLRLRDPQVDMRYQRPTLNRSEQPLTKMAKEATAGKTGVDVDGYRDYRGVYVLGAWTWLPKYGFGVATEVDMAEAYAPLYILRGTFWGLFALLAGAALIIFLGMLFMTHMQTKMRQAVIEAKQVGQYTLEEKLGAGGMGVVYKAKHALLRRPTAVKMLDADKTTEVAIQRFEREVQITSQLNHPNTIAIYDFGRTPEGLFFYAMEYLDGIPLDTLVEQFGPQPEGRVIFILEQICGSLAEAHEAELIHRDIKPANIIINRRGGVADLIKVLDFGLVKALDGKRNVTMTAADSITGTPQYLSPEGIESPTEVDARSDIYAVGAVGYFLLTGTPVFQGTTILEVCKQQVGETPQLPSERAGREISFDLEQVLMRCLAKKKEDRPSSARELSELLEQCQSADKWTQKEAMAWWGKLANMRGEPGTSSAKLNDATDKTVIYGQGDLTSG